MDLSIHSDAGTPLRVLMVDDSAADIALNLRALRELDRPVVSETVCTGDSLREALHRFDPDVILSDFSMPGFSGQEALEIARALRPEIPFIYVSGTIGEELAIEAMQRGASDYVLKDNLRRLRPAIDRALEAARREREGERMQLALRESEERFRSLVETTDEWIWEIDLQRRNVYSNASVLKMIGHAAESIRGHDFVELMMPEDRDAMLALLPQCVAGRHGWQNLVKRWAHADGSVRMIESSAQPILDEQQQVRGFRGIGRDVTLREQQARKITQLARIEAVLSAHGNAVLRARDANELLDVTCRVAVEQGGFLAAVIGREQPARRLTMTNWFGDPGVIGMIAKLGPADLDGEDVHRRLSARSFSQARRIITPEYSRSDAAPELREAMARVGVASQIALPIGSPPWAVLGLFSATAQQVDDEEISLLERLTAQIDYAQDFITKSERLEYLAYHNPVTGLPNRTSFAETIGARLERGPHVVAMVDIDRFRYFNNSRGRSFGDHLLTAVGTQLRAAMPPDALFAHPGDDSFVFAYPSTETLAEAVRRIGELVHTCCEKQFLVDGEEVQVHLHASVLLAPTHADSAESIERSLVAVLAEAQGNDKPVLAFTEDVRSRASARADMERDLSVALASDAFELFLQPKFNAASQRLTGAEALLRWRHPERGLVSPAQFIPVLEETGMVIEVGAWVRRRGLEIWKRWDDQGQAGLRVAVNVSARELRHSGFVDGCTRLLEPFMGDHGLDIEITESMLMDDIGKSVQVLQCLRELGCKIAIDDFGTGYSSLNYLSRLPADTLKIDQSFTNALALSPDTLSLVTNIISLAHSLNLKVVAEGVEEEEQAKLLRLLRCDELQGYHLGRPMPVDEFEQKFLS